MIPRTLVPEKLNPVRPDDGEKKPPRRLTTLLDERTVVPTGQSPDAPPLDGKSSIPQHLPLGVLVDRTLVPRGIEAKPFENLQPLSDYAPIAILDSRVVVPAYVEPAAPEEIKAFEKAPELTADLREMVEPDIYLTGEANLLVETEEKRDPKWDLITRIASVGVHIGLIIFLISIPKIFPAHVPTNEEISQASQLLGKVFIPPGEIPKTPLPPQPHVKINKKALEKAAPPRPEEHAPILPPTPPAPRPPRPDLPEAPIARTPVNPTPTQPVPVTPPPSQVQPIHPYTQQPPAKLNLGLPNSSPGKAIQDDLAHSGGHNSGGTFSTGGSIPRGAGAGGGAGQVGNAVTILSPTEGVDFSNYIQRLLATLKRNWYAVMPESAMMGDQGVVFTTFQINHDGSVQAPDPTLERTSGKDPLDRAAMSAIRASNPFEPLPPQFHGPYLRLRIVFLYNVRPDQLNPQ